MLHKCNVLNVVDVGSTDTEQGHMREQDCGTVRKVCANRTTTV